MSVEIKDFDRFLREREGGGMRLKVLGREIEAPSELPWWYVLKVERLLKAYDVTYIFIGAKEREKFGEELNPGALSTLTNVVYSDGYGTQILRVNWQ